MIFHELLEFDQGNFTFYQAFWRWFCLINIPANISVHEIYFFLFRNTLIRITQITETNLS